MPINPIGVKNRKGTLGSPYAVRDYRAVNPELGTLEDFDWLVKEAAFSAREVPDHLRGLRARLG